MTPLRSLHSTSHYNFDDRVRVKAIMRTYPDAESLEPALHRGEMRLMAEALLAFGRGVPDDVVLMAAKWAR